MTLTVLWMTQAVMVERRRCVGILLAEIGRQRLSGRRDIAEALEAMVTEMEHTEAATEMVGY